MIVHFQQVQAARSAMLAERATITSQIGLHFALARCPECDWEADGTGTSPGQAEGRALRDLAQHLIRTHRGNR